VLLAQFQNQVPLLALTALGVPVAQRFAFGATIVDCPAAVPQAPLMLAKGVTDWLGVEARLAPKALLARTVKV
jgi:hypothetical protein